MESKEEDQEGILTPHCDPSMEFTNLLQCSTYGEQKASIIEVPGEFPGRNTKHSRAKEVSSLRKKERIRSASGGGCKRTVPNNRRERLTKDKTHEMTKMHMVSLEEYAHKKKMRNKGQRFMKRICTELHLGHQGKEDFQESCPGQEGHSLLLRHMGWSQD